MFSLWQATKPWRNSEPSLTPVWSPDGRRVAWLFQQHRAQHVNGDWETDDDVRAVIDRGAGPCIQIVGKNVRDAVFAAATEALERAGFAPTCREAAQTERTASVVYAAAGQAAAAKAVAAALPGGATIEALSWNWKSRFDLVVALAAH